MPITPSDLIPGRQVSEVATGQVASVGVGIVSVRIRPDLTVVISTLGTYSVGQRVTVVAPGGQWGRAQILGVASGSSQRVRHVSV